MNAENTVSSAASINGHMIALCAEHLIAIYERNRECYVAEFRHGNGSLEYASSWFRFHAASLRCYKGGVALRSAIPLNPEILEKIERLHAESDARQERMFAMPRSTVVAVVRYWMNLMQRLRCRAAKISRTFS